MHGVGVEFDTSGLQVVRIRLESKILADFKENTIVFYNSEAGSDSQRGVYIDVDPIAGTKAYRQGALAVDLTRASGQQDTTWDGNPDTAVNISAKNSAANTASEGAI